MGRRVGLGWTFYSSVRWLNRNASRPLYLTYGTQYQYSTTSYTTPMPPKSWKRTASTESPIPETVTARDVSIPPAQKLSRTRIAEIRGSLRLSQSVFAQALNVSPDTIRGWEQGKRVPDGASLRLLELAEKHPEWLMGVIENAPDSNSKPIGGGAHDS